MLNKWKQKAIQMNLRKAVICFVVVCILFAVASFAVLYIGFHDRFDEWERIAETEYKYGSGGQGKRDDKWNDGFEFGDGKNERGYSDIENKMDFGQNNPFHFSGSELALIAVCGIIGMVLVLWYWILCIIWAYRKACRMETNHLLWVLAALVFHIFAVIALYLYAAARGTCEGCGKLKKSGARFCDRCGKQFKKECEQCGQVINVDSEYCSNCGKKQNEKEE